MVQSIKDILNNGLQRKIKINKGYFNLTGKRGSGKKKIRAKLVNILKQTDNNLSKLREAALAAHLDVKIIFCKKEFPFNENNDLFIEYDEQTYSEKNCKNENLLDKIVKIKDETNTSYRTLSKFGEIISGFPGTYKVRTRTNTKYLHHWKKYRNKYGSYVNCSEKICYFIRKNFKRLDIKDKTIRVKICGDGTNIGKKIKQLNFCFTLPDEGLRSQTASGNYTLGIFKIRKEDYDNLDKALYECNENLKKFCDQKEIDIEGEKYKIQFLLGGDMKFIHEVMGLNQCNSKNCCFLCKITKEEFSKNNLAEIKCEKRSIDELLEKIKKIPYFDKEHVNGYKKAPIFSFITFDDLVFDTLHLSLRLPEKLIKLITSEFIRLDANDSLNIDKLPHQKRFYESLINIGICKPYNIINNENTKKIELRSINGSESLLIMEKLNFEASFPKELFPKFNKAKEFTLLCNTFSSIFVKLKKNFYINNHKQCEKDTGEWLKIFIKTFDEKHVTTKFF